MDFQNVRDENAYFGQPKNWNETTDGKCGTLPVRVGGVEVPPEVEAAVLPLRKEAYGRFAQYTSAWKPNVRELQLLNSGGSVEVHLVGVQCPMALSVVEPLGIVTVDDHERDKQQRTIAINETAHGDTGTGYDEFGPAYPL